MNEFVLIKDAVAFNKNIFFKQGTDQTTLGLIESSFSFKTFSNCCANFAKICCTGKRAPLMAAKQIWSC